MEPSSTPEEVRPAQPLGATRHPPGDQTELPGAGELSAAFNDLVESVERLSRQVDGFFARHGEQHPGALLACATVLGFILGGGLASRTGGLLTRTGGRFAVEYFLRRRSETDRMRLHSTGVAEPFLK